MSVVEIPTAVSTSHTASGKTVLKRCACPDRNDDRKPRSFADEQQVLASVNSQDVSVPVAEARAGLDGRQLAGLFQPDEQLLCTPQNDHRFVSLPYDIVAACSRARWPARSWVESVPETSAILDAIRATFLRTIGTQTGGVSDPAGRPGTGQIRGRPGPHAPLPRFLSSAGGPAGTRRRPTLTRTAAQVSAAVRLRNQGVSLGDDRPCTTVVTIPMVEGADGQVPIVPPPRPPSLSDR